MSIHQTATWTNGQSARVAILTTEESPPKSRLLAATIPKEMQHARRWVCWKWERGKKKWTKVPIRPDGSAASSTDANTWSDFSTVVQAYNDHGWVAGIGFVLGDGWAGVDFDACLDPDTGDCDPRVMKIIDRFGSYSETSPTGTGIKTVVRGEKPRGRCSAQDPDVECYGSGRFFTVTGDRWGDTPRRITEGTDVLVWLQATYLDPPETRTTSCGTDDVETAREALRWIPAKYADTYPDWVRVGLACRSIDPEALREDWVGWSRKGAAYGGDDDCRQKWSQLPTDAQIGVGTLVYLAKEGGYQPSSKTSGAETLTSPDSPGEPADWRKPDRLPEPLPSVDPYSHDLLPGEMGEFVTDISERMQSPPDYAAASLLVSLGAIVGCAVGIRPKRYDDWLVVPNLWGCVVGRPSLKKTPAVAGPKGILDRMEKVAREDMAKEIEQAARDLVARPVEIEEMKRSLKKAIKDGDTEERDRIADEIRKLTEEAPPEPRRIITNDPTLAKLGEMLARFPRGLLLFRDELLSWLKTLDREDHQGDRQAYLELWTGHGRYTVDRIGRGTIPIESPCLSVFGCMTPGPFGSYLAAAISGGTGDDGLLQRLQVTVWPDAPRQYKHVDRWPNGQIRSAVEATFEKLLRLDAADIGASADRDGEIPYLRFDADGQSVFDEWLGTLEMQLRDSELPEAYESHLSKYRSLMPSVALVMHLASGGVGPVTGDSARLAVRWVEYLTSHARRIYAAAICAERQTAPVLLARLVKWTDEGPITARAIGRKGWSGLTNKEAIAESLQLLVETGWLRAVEDPPGKAGRRTTSYVLHPEAEKHLQAYQLSTDKADKTPPHGRESSVSSVPKPDVSPESPPWDEFAEFGGEVDL